MRLFDTHCHLGLIHTDMMEQLLAVQYAKRAGVRHIVSVCNNPIDFQTQYSNLRSAKNVYHAVGVSPSETGGSLGNWEDLVRNNARLDRVVAIGETGLDYVKNFAPKDVQVDYFIKHLDIARTAHLPVIIHDRGAGRDILDILKSRIPAEGAVFHCFSEDWVFAMEALDLPVWFSFAGNITYHNVRPLIETVRNLPADRILIESEAPFMVPAKYTKKRNKPEYLPENLLAIARIRNTDPEEMAQTIYANSLRAFGLPPEEI